MGRGSSTAGRDDCWISNGACALLDSDTEKRWHGWATCKFNIVQLEINVPENTERKDEEIWKRQRKRERDEMENRRKRKTEAKRTNKDRDPSLAKFFLDRSFLHENYVPLCSKRNSFPVSKRDTRPNSSRLNFLSADSGEWEEDTRRTLSNCSPLSSSWDVKRHKKKLNGTRELTHWSHVEVFERVIYFSMFWNLREKTEREIIYWNTQ